MFDDCGDELLRSRLHAQVDDGESGAFKHDVNEVLANIVNVTFDSSHDESAYGLGTSVGQQWA
ncbi:hypothetical protein GALL_444360 [mine drainage metagenome]|uniref:Uncharacterized protein n=1 Tax=mine drainage metagenome TaxID=410659 RepID=A0A1J5Q208_9ZZZZ